MCFEERISTGYNSINKDDHISLVHVQTHIYPLTIYLTPYDLQFVCDVEEGKKRDGRMMKEECKSVRGEVGMKTTDKNLEDQILLGLLWLDEGLVLRILRRYFLGADGM